MKIKDKGAGRRCKETGNCTQSAKMIHHDEKAGYSTDSLVSTPMLVTQVKTQNHSQTGQHSSCFRFSSTDHFTNKDPLQQ